MTAFAGSIGIIGIAAILALPNGVNGYIKKVEEDTLSGYPLTISKQDYDLSSMMSGQGATDDEGGTVPLVVHGLELSVALILAEEVEGHMTKSTVGGDAVLVAFIFPWHFLVYLSVLASLEVPCRELLEFGVAYVVEDAAVNDLCAWSTCTKGQRRPAHSAPARGGKQDDRFACQVVRLEERVDNRRRHVPPDGKSQKDDVVVFDVLDSGGYGRAAGGVCCLECAAALFVTPVKVGACVWIGGYNGEQVAVRYTGQATCNVLRGSRCAEICHKCLSQWSSFRCCGLGLMLRCIWRCLMTAMLCGLSCIRLRRCEAGR